MLPSAFLKLPIASTCSQLSPQTESKPISVDRSQHDVLLNDIFHLSATLPTQPQPTPVLTPSDRSRNGLLHSETVLEGEMISCFVVGGEKRLCFPQVLNAVLRDVSLLDINRACCELNINCSQCSVEQLDVLKSGGVLPTSASSCGLITKSDAERLVNCYLLLNRKPRCPQLPVDVGKSSGIPVVHHCFGGARGVFFANLYRSPSAECIQCAQCGDIMATDKFVVHSHREGAERRTCHWGFDSANWRAYLHLPSNLREKEDFKDRLDDMKKKFKSLVIDSRNVDAKRKLLETAAPSMAEVKKPRAENNPPRPCVVYEAPLLAYYQQTLLRYQAMLQGIRAPVVLPARPASDKAAVAAAGLLALSATAVDAARSTESKAKEARAPPTHPEPLKKQLLHQFEEEQKKARESPKVPAEGSRSTSTASESSEDESSLDQLLKKHIVDKATLKMIREKIAESQRSLETKVDSLSAHNQILQQEIAYLRNKQNTAASLLGGKGGGFLMGHC